MRRIVPVILSAFLLASYGQLVHAQGKGGGGAPAGRPAPGGQGAANWNSPSSPDRATGLNRAQQRMSEQGKAHEKATEAPKKKGQASAATRATPAVPGNPTTPAIPATPASPANK
jgi:hypothetical protein